MSEPQSIDRQVRRLDDRIRALETLVLRGWCAAVGVALLLGVLVPFGYETKGDDETFVYSVLTAPFVSISQGWGQDVDTDEAAFAVLFVSGFIGLALVAAALLIGLLVIGGREATERAHKVLRVLLVLAGVGTAVVLIFTAMIAGSDNVKGDAGPGGVVLLAGVIGYATLLSQAGRGWWMQKPVARPRASGALDR